MPSPITLGKDLLTQHHLLEQIPSAAFTCDSDGRLTAYNERAVKIWGDRPPLGQPGRYGGAMVVNLPGSNENFAGENHPIARVAKAGETIHEKEAYLTRPDGRIRTVTYNASPLYDLDGALVGAICCFEDITSIRESERRYRQIIETAREGIWIIDTKGATTLANPRMAEMLGYTVDEMLGRTMFEFMDDDARETAENNLRKRISGIAEQHDFRLKHRDGSAVYVVMSTNPQYDDRGNITGALALVNDVTDKKKEEEALKKAKEEAESANQIKSAFLANMSHEIRTPLGAILGFTDLLKEPQLSQEERLNYLNIIGRNGEQLASLINDILDLSKVEAGELKVAFDACDLSELIGDTVSLLGKMAKDKGLELLVHLDRALPSSILTDPIRLKQILVNIIGNAVKFTRAGRIEVSAYPRARSIVIDVLDTGIGIEPDALDKLFLPFSQADESMTRKYGGTGLGLALSKRLASMLGGNIELVRSDPGRGSLFRVTIVPPTNEQSRAFSASRPTETHSAPANEEESRAIASGEPPDALKDVRVLLVEDSTDNQLYISRMLSKHGAQVELASNGEEGLKSALEREFDIVLMDIQMPVLDGYSATQRLRDLGYSKPIISLTAHAMNEVRQKCLNVGCTDHLPKPVNRNNLVEKIKRYAHREHGAHH